MTEPRTVEGKFKNLIITLAVLLAVNLCCTGYLLATQLSVDSSQQGTQQLEQEVADDEQQDQTAAQNEQTKYVLYIGTNDKDTYKQEIPYKKCVKIVTEICTRYADGCTLAQANGYWKDDSGQITKEQSIECILEDVSIDQVRQIADEVRSELNQNSILIETQGVTSEFYAG